MQFTNTRETLEEIVTQNVSPDTNVWLRDKLDKIIAEASAKELYLTYSLLAGKVDISKPITFPDSSSRISEYLKNHKADILQISRICILTQVLDEKPDFFISKVANLIQVADTGELETFLKFLIVLPNAKEFKNVAVEALRTNIATLFDAISLNNPYPSEHFNDQQWNQMYLKAAFMQRNLAEIMEVDKMANADLARIISDYAHERWAASRDIDPLFWRPVTNFIEGQIIEDMQRLLKSDIPEEAAAGALCCFHSKQPMGMTLLDNYPELKERAKGEEISWKKLKD